MRNRGRWSRAASVVACLATVFVMVAAPTSAGAQGPVANVVQSAATGCTGAGYCRVSSADGPATVWTGRYQQICNGHLQGSAQGFLVTWSLPGGGLKWYWYYKGESGDAVPATGKGYNMQFRGSQILSDVMYTSSTITQTGVSMGCTLSQWVFTRTNRQLTMWECNSNWLFLHPPHFVPWPATAGGDSEGCYPVIGTEPPCPTLSPEEQLASPECSLTVDWAMPSRLSRSEMESWSVDPWGLPLASYVNPAEWDVTLSVSSSTSDACAPGLSYSWNITGNGLGKRGQDFVHTVFGGCKVDTTVPKLGTYDVSVLQYKNNQLTGRRGDNTKVVLQDWLIVGLGDSNGSGEGDGPPWESYQCDRSAGSYQYKTAQYIEDQVQPHSSVTLVWASCSGAKTNNLYSDKYSGAHASGALLPPQIEQVHDLIGDRKVNAVIMSIGVNDIGFAPLVASCVIAYVLGRPPCQDLGVKVAVDGTLAAGTWPAYDYSYDSGSDVTLAQQTSMLLAGLPRSYADLDLALKQQLGPQHVFITQYPDFSRNQNGALCGTPTPGVDQGPWPHFSVPVWGWLEQTGQRLNAAVANTRGYGWVPVTGIPGAFVDHGYCSTSTDFVSLPAAVSTVWHQPLQQDLAGAFHPTDAGQDLSAEQTEPLVCDSLYGNPTCTGPVPSNP